MCISQPVLLHFVDENAGDTSCSTLVLMSNKAFFKLALMPISISKFVTYFRCWKSRYSIEEQQKAQHVINHTFVNKALLYPLLYED